MLHVNCVLLNSRKFGTSRDSNSKLPGINDCPKNCLCSNKVPIDYKVFRTIHIHRFMFIISIDLSAAEWEAIVSVHIQQNRNDISKDSNWNMHEETEADSKNN